MAKKTDQVTGPLSLKIAPWVGEGEGPSEKGRKGGWACSVHNTYPRMGMSQ